MDQVGRMLIISFPNNSLIRKENNNDQYFRSDLNKPFIGFPFELDVKNS